MTYFGLLAVVLQLVGFPLEVAGFHWEKKHGLSKQKLKGWFWDKVKAWCVGAVIGIGILSGLIAIVRYFPGNWWLAFAFFFVLVSIVLAQLVPIVLIPIFIKMKPMPDNELKARLLDLCKKHSVKVKEVYQLGLGEKTEKGNAAFLGLGSTKRIAIGDTLYEKFPADEIEAVFAHELGHQIAQDIWRSLVLSSGLMVIGLFLAFRGSNAYLFPHLRSIEIQPEGLFAFFFLFSLVQIPLGWIQLAHSRWREKSADEFAAKVSNAKALASALERLTIQNWGLFYPNPILEWFTYSHPSPHRRISAMRADS